MNITKLAIWPQLEKLGFERINYRFHGKLVAVGASLMAEKTDYFSGQKFKTDLITIEPSCSGFSDGKSYHITGHGKKPLHPVCYRYEGGRKVEYFNQDTFVNEYFSAREILPTIEKMLAD